VDVTASSSMHDCSIHSATGTTVPGNLYFTAGGVARNIAEACHRASAKQGCSNFATLLISPVSDDSMSDIIRSKSHEVGMSDLGLISVPGARTACVNMLMKDDGGLIFGIADTSILDNFPSDQVLDILKNTCPGLVALDANVAPSTLSDVILYCRSREIPVLFEPTSVTKSVRILDVLHPLLHPDNTLAPVAFISPNMRELAAIHKHCTAYTHHRTSSALMKIIHKYDFSENWQRHLDDLAAKPISGLGERQRTLSTVLNTGLVDMAISLLPYFQNNFIKCQDAGVIAVMRIPRSGQCLWETFSPRNRVVLQSSKDKEEVIVIQHFPPLPVQPSMINTVTGAGDSFVGSLCSSLALNPRLCAHPAQLTVAVNLAQKSAVAALLSIDAVSSGTDYSFTL